MSIRSELAERLTDCLRGVSRLLKRAHQATLAEQEALVRNDVQALMQCCKAQDEILRRIGESDQVAAQIATQLAKIAGVDPETADAVVAARAAGEPYGEAILAEVREISESARKVREESEINRKLVDNGLDVVTSCLRTLASDPTPNAYSNEAALTGPSSGVLAVDKRA